MSSNFEHAESVVHRALAQHSPGDICEECPTRDRVLVQLAAAIDPDAFDGNKKRSKQPAALVQWAARRHMAYEAAEKVLRPILEAVDLCWKATPYGSTEDGDTAAYILPKGTVHRLVGALQGIGVSASLRAIPADEVQPHITETRKP